MAEAHQLAFAFFDLLDVGGDVVLGADLVEHAEDFFVGSAVQRSGEGRRGRGGREVGIGLRTADGAHGVGAAVLLVVGVQDEEDVERARDDGIGGILRLDHLPEHVHEVFSIAEIVIGIDVREADAVTIGHGGDGGNLADEPLDLVEAVGRIVNLARSG